MVSGYQACIVVSMLGDNCNRCRAERGPTRPSRSFIGWDTRLEITQVMKAARSYLCMK